MVLYRYTGTVKGKDTLEVKEVNFLLLLLS